MRLLFPGKDERGDLALNTAIHAEIAAAGGAIPFSRFMDLCLQHPSRGYYRRGRTRAGHGGDFLTSPEAHPAFAGVMARQLEVLGEALGAAAPVWLEAGAGTGTMANKVAELLGTRARVIALDTAAHVHPVDEGAQSAPLRVRASGLPFAPGALTGIYANELLDAFPVHRLVRRGDGWRELFVGGEGETFHWVEAEATPEAALEAGRALRRGARVAEGNRVELALGFRPWLAECARVIERGFLLLADYGDDTPRLVNEERPGGTLRCFAGHSVHDDPLRFVGTQDLTASVDFGALVEHAQAAGFQTVAFLEQRAWLDAWGVPAARAGIASLGLEGKLRGDEVETNGRAIDYLLDPRGLGRVKVVCFAKGVRPMPIPGLTSDVPAARRFTAEDLPLTRLFDPFADLLE